MLRRSTGAEFRHPSSVPQPGDRPPRGLAKAIVSRRRPRFELLGESFLPAVSHRDSHVAPET